MAFKVIEIGSNRKPVCDFLLVINTLCLKKHPRHSSCNSRKHCRIFIMFGTRVTEKVINQ